MAPTVIYEDDQGSMIDYPDDDYVEIRWYDASSQFTTDTFNRRQEIIASVVEQCGRSHILIDAMQFGMNAQDMDIDWRRRQHHPAFQRDRGKEASPHRARRISAHGAPPAPEGPADFPTAYFATRAEARAWLSS